MRDKLYTNPNLKQNNAKYRSLEFKYLYFKLQSLINKQVKLTLKYEQMKSPEIHATLIKPISSKVIELANTGMLRSRLGKVHQATNIWSPKLEFLPEYTDSTLSIDLVFILLLLRYEYTIQSVNNLIRYELLQTKANLCELLAIRMLREYSSRNRTNILLEKPLKEFNKDFNTLELSVLCKAKKFLSQPVITHILEKFYNGELIIKGKYNIDKSLEEQPLTSSNIVNYQFTKVSFRNVNVRANVVPKYQSIVINLKLMFFTILYFILILNYKNEFNDGLPMKSIELLFWLMGVNFNFEFLIKVLSIEFVYFKKILWNYVDLVLILLIDIAFVLKFVSHPLYSNVFSLISIIIMPRMLSVFNNYEFFNLLVLSLKKMSWKLFGFFCMYISLISGFYLSFISLTLNLSNYDIAFDMLKIFFGFTPAVWNNWDNYNNVGRVVQMGYLFLIQFIIGTILAIVLSQVFAKVNETNKEEFNYTKTVNLILYFKTSKLHFDKGSYSTLILNKILNIFKLPIVASLFVYELILSKAYSRKRPEHLKYFTFLNKEKDYYEDSDLMRIDDDTDISMVTRSRKPSDFYRRGSNNFQTTTLNPVHSINTMANFRSASTDSLFIDAMLGKKYGNLQSGKLQLERTKTETSEMSKPFVKPLMSKISVLDINSRVRSPTNAKTGDGQDPDPASMTLTKQPKNVKDILATISNDQLVYSQFYKSLDPEFGVSHHELDNVNENDITNENQNSDSMQRMYNITEMSLSDLNLIDSSDDDHDFLSPIGINDDSNESM